RDSAPGRIARVAGRTPETLRLVHDEQIDSRSHRLIGQLRTLDQHVDRDHDTAMHVEGVEVGTKVARDIGEARGVEQRENLVVLSPELTQPLHRQGFWYDDKRAFDF